MNKQRGFTLVELMVTGIISLFLMASLMNLFITTNKTVALSDALSQNQETGRFGLEYMTRFIRLAGFKEDFSKFAPPILHDRSLEEAFLRTLGTANPIAMCAADACSANNPTNALGDRLSIPFVTRENISMRSCTGTLVGGPNTTPQLIGNVFWVSNEADTMRELRCRTYNYETGAWIDASAVSIVNNVESFEFQLGVAATVSTRNASRYVNVDEISPDTAPTIDHIRSIRISLLTTSQDELDQNKIQTSIEERKYALLDGPTITTTDGNLKQIYSNTIELPSFIEGAVFNSDLAVDSAPKEDP